MVSRGSKIVVGTMVVLGAAVMGFQALSGGDLFRTATNSVSRSLCGAAFISQVDPDRIFREEQLPNMRSIGWAVHYHVDREQREVRTTVLGAFGARAVYRPGLGCLLVHGGDAVPDVAGLGDGSDTDGTSVADPMGPNVVEPNDPAIRQAFDIAFSEPDVKNPRLTKGIVVLHDGKLIGERYAPGYGPQTPIWGHSLTKSVTNALVGILVRQGKLHMDPRIDQLLRMDSGLPFDETGGPLNPMSRMFFLENDMARFAAGQPLAHPAGSTWAYSNLGYVLLSRMAMDAAGARDAVAAERFVRSELFAPLGMRHAVIETDVAGTPVGSSHVYASTRDFARFGQLYLDDGVVDGQRILPEGWVGYSHSQTLDTGYGAGFWTNLVDKGSVPVWDAPWELPGLPRDTYFARGAFGQYIVIVPSERLVVARLGISVNGGTGIAEVVAKIIAALHSPQESRSQARL
ncbi:serine hydrolase domain-containing protein [Pinirhizobacter soli]|uniref:serine hydrolase domain-containing protein n=1 Tax=Pinirhizobacter soli TaxID=2786953 RepID=UPI00202A02A6|nr:serine hydrolase [Pinirhizobacter soli]